ncbi:MAG TPA: FlgD immunoglobulin-like domain containing protein, partial [Candidatus Krumholzibacteria bacterium]|nr:FlgD immunoglobulin-like domain containing protein [Candidatus Krumholzibacteria bacterium]
MRSSTAIILLLALAAAAPAQTYTWQGWGGPDGTNSAWGASWSPSSNVLANGWGETWNYWEDPAAHFPALTSDVILPAGMILDSDGGSAPYCASLTVGAGSLLQLQYTNLAMNGPTLTNDGRIDLIAAGGVVSGLYLSGPLSVEGEGEIVLAPGRFHSDAASMAVTIGAGQFVHGEGHFGSEPYGNYHGIALTNLGRIRATGATGQLVILSSGSVNQGTLEAGTGSQLWLAGDFDNTGGEILADDGLVWLMPDALHPCRIEGGVLRTAGAGEIRPESEGSLKNVTVEGLLHLRRYTSVHMSDVIVNNGEFKQGLDGWAGYATVFMDSALTFQGDGVLRMGAANEIKMGNWLPVNSPLTNGSGHTIESYGGRFGAEPNYYGDQRIEMINDGTILALESPYAVEFHVTGAGFENRGLLSLRPAASVDAGIWGPFLQTAGKLECDDRFNAFTHPIRISGGTLAGQVGLGADVRVDGTAVIQPGDEDEIGTLHVWGPLTLGDGATLAWEWTAYGQDLVQVHGAFTATGDVTLRVVDPVTAPDKSADLVVLTSASHDDQATWTVELPVGWTHDTLEWVGNDLVLRGLSGTPTAVEEAPARTMLLGASPNPFNPRTTLRYALAQAGPVRLTVSDMRGRRLAVLVDGVRPAGEHAVVWDGRDAAGRALGSGAYVGVFEAEGRRETRR